MQTIETLGVTHLNWAENIEFCTFITRYLRIMETQQYTQRFFKQLRDKTNISLGNKSELLAQNNL